MINFKSSKVQLALGLILTAALSRLIPHSPNFTSVGALALFAGSLWGISTAAFLVPLLAMLLTDLILGFHPTMFFVYGAFLLTVILGGGLLKKTQKNLPLIGLSLAASSVFFIVTNFGVWFVGGFYSQDMKGLLECFAMALPFFKNQIAGDLVYSLALFNAYRFVASSIDKKMLA